ncbi:MAG: DUF7520 family protein [Haloferacaceae archaeon]
MADGWSGQRIVLTMYAILVTAAGVFGAVIPQVVEEVRPPTYLFLIELPPTSFGLAAYGALTVATILAVPLAGVVLASRYAVDDGRGPDAG